MDIKLAIDQMNARSLEARMTYLETEYERRLRHLEQELATLDGLVKAQNTVIGQYLAQAMGHGSTEVTDGDQH